MAGGVAYVDSSAFVKIVVEEPESPALLRALGRWPQLASASLLKAEAVRALRRSGNVDQVDKAKRLLRAVRLISVDEPLLDTAGDLEPADLRTLDAMHLAAALTLGPELGPMFVYDDRLKHSAEALGLDTRSPR